MTKCVASTSQELYTHISSAATYRPARAYVLYRARRPSQRLRALHLGRSALALRVTPLILCFYSLEGENKKQEEDKAPLALPPPLPPPPPLSSFFPPHFFFRPPR